MGEEISFEELLLVFHLHQKTWRRFHAFSHRPFFFRVKCLPGSRFFLSGLCFQRPVPRCVSHLCMTWLWGLCYHSSKSLLPANIAACPVLLPWGVVVSQRAQQLPLVAGINAVNYYSGQVEELKAPIQVPILQVHLSGFSFYKGIEGSGPGVSVFCTDERRYALSLAKSLQPRIPLIRKAS